MPTQLKNIMSVLAVVQRLKSSNIPVSVYIIYAHTHTQGIGRKQERDRGGNRERHTHTHTKPIERLAWFYMRDRLYFSYLSITIFPIQLIYFFYLYTNRCGHINSHLSRYVKTLLSQSLCFCIQVIVNTADL